MKALQIGCVAMVLLIPGFKVGGTSLPRSAEGHSSGVVARVVSADGTNRTIKLEGVGCTESMCSRVFIRSKSESGTSVQTWLDSVAAVKDTTNSDALFVMKDGTERRLTLMPDFRILYVSSPSGRVEKLDLSKIQSLEFVGSAK
jgi:hypothetical protein